MLKREQKQTLRIGYDMAIFIHLKSGPDEAIHYLDEITRVTRRREDRRKHPSVDLVIDGQLSFQ